MTSTPLFFILIIEGEIPVPQKVGGFPLTAKEPRYNTIPFKIRLGVTWPLSYISG